MADSLPLTVTMQESITKPSLKTTLHRPKKTLIIFGPNQTKLAIVIHKRALMLDSGQASRIQ